MEVIVVIPVPEIELSPPLPEVALPDVTAVPPAPTVIVYVSPGVKDKLVSEDPPPPEDSVE